MSDSPVSAAVSTPVSASKEEEPVSTPVSTPVSAPVSASKEEDPVSTSVSTSVSAIAQHRGTVIQHLVDGNSDAAFQTLMTDHNGLLLDYAESRMLYG